MFSEISTNNNFQMNQADPPQTSETSTSLISRYVPHIYLQIIFLMYVLCTLYCSISPTHTPKKQKLSFDNPRYFNDLTEEHFSTPKRAKRHLEFAKKKYNDIRKKLNKVKQLNRRLTKKVKTYQDLTKTLNDSNLLTENVAQFCTVTLHNQ